MPLGVSTNDSSSTSTSIPHNNKNGSRQLQLGEQVSHDGSNGQTLRGSPNLSDNPVNDTNKGSGSAKDLEARIMPATKTLQTDLIAHTIEKRGFAEGSASSLPIHHDRMPVFDILPPFPGVAHSTPPIPTNHTPSRSKSPQQSPHSHLPRPSSRSHITRPLSRGHIEFTSAVRQQRSKSPNHRELPQSPDRIRKPKPRRKTKPPNTLHSVETQPKSQTIESAPSQEDLLNVLLFRAQQEKRGRDVAKAMQEAKDAELDEIKAHCIDLNAQIQVLRENEKARDILLEKYQKTVPGWKEKLRKFESYLTGLTNDHHQLRDGAKDIQKQQEALRTDGLAVKASLGEIQGVLGQRSFGSKDVLTKAKHEIELLEQVVHDQGAQLNEDSELLDYERKRNQRLEERISEITNNQTHMSDLVLSYRQAVAGKLDELLKHSQTLQSGDQKNDESQVEVKLDRCVSLLEEVRTSQTVKPSDLNHFETSIRSYAAR